MSKLLQGLSIMGIGLVGIFAVAIIIMIIIEGLSILSKIEKNKDTD